MGVFAGVSCFVLKSPGEILMPGRTPRILGPDNQKRIMNLSLFVREMD